MLDGPVWISVEGERITYFLLFVGLSCFGGWNCLSTTCKRVKRAEFVLEWHVGVEVDVLVWVCRFSEDIEGERAVGVALNVDVQHMRI